MFELDRESRKHIPEPDLVPILDGLTSVIFFLLLSISFIGLTKITLPPSSSSTITSVSQKPPLSPRLRVTHEGKNLSLELDWVGTNPDQIKAVHPRDEEQKVLKELIEKVSAIVKEFKDKYPEEKTMQLAMSEDLNYQEMISVMDGIRPLMDDIVLNSYKETEQ